MNNVLLLTNKIDKYPGGGRELLCKLNHNILKEIYGAQCTVFELPKNSIRGTKAILFAFRGYIDGLSTESIDEALRVIQMENIEKIFVDGSNFGQFVKIVKTKYPNIQVYTFFHNVEARFFWGSLKQVKTLRAFAVLVVNYLAERKSVKYSDKIICLNERDSHLLQRVYGRSATDIAPMALEDKLPIGSSAPAKKITEKFALFVGGTFYANQAGVFWFIEHVVPHISIKTYIVGRGFEKFKKELEVSENVVVVGEVDSLAQWYHDAYFVVAPIFDGSGMKTKVAEALMFGKKIIGTPEAFTGYEQIADQVGRICLSADDFIVAIEEADEIVKHLFDSELRLIYESLYSYAAARERLDMIMNDYSE
ncbi:glycosyltransferase [Methyloprofundus sp.]|uniref:glycosyltransferase n=1 Tax=Methyloprofundus sp. TaxID=2020875 RepID=UPI003D0EB022